MSKKRLLWSMGMLTLAAFGVLFHLVMGDNFDQRKIAPDLGDMRYVLVNEDLGASFNGTFYHLGSELVTLISQDDDTHWQTASRSVAEAGFANGVFDVMIVLPQNFSERLLSLESIHPEQATIFYDVQLSDNVAANAAVRAQVGDILADFDARIVQMYFSSILGSLFEAQLNVAEMNRDEQGRYARFIDHIQAPFNAIPAAFLSVMNRTERLEIATESWQEEHNQFGSAASEMVLHATARLAEQATAVEQFSEEVYHGVTRKNVSLSEQLLDFETELVSHLDQHHVLFERNEAHAQNAVNNQAVADEGFYRAQFSGLNAIVQNSLTEFYHESDVGSTTLLGQFEQVAGEFYRNQSQQIMALSGQIETLGLQADELLALRSEISRIFFSDANLSPVTVTDEDLRRAVRHFIADEVEDETANLIETHMVERFAAEGISLYNALTVSHQSLVTTIWGNPYQESLSLIGILTAMPEASLLQDETDAWRTWHDRTQLEVAAFYDNWEQAYVQTVRLEQQTDLFDIEENRPDVYFERPLSDDIVTAIQVVLATLIEEAEQTLSDANATLDLDDNFTQITSQTEEARALSEAIYAEMEVLSEDTSRRVAGNTVFAENFSQVMSNARFGGADNLAVLRFLASPIYLVGRYTGAINEGSLLPFGTREWLLLGYFSLMFTMILVIVYHLYLLKQGNEPVESV
ncbi:MAG: type VII secretion protein EsaA [Turicibacter sp.]|nr:type VII secretion protein EsaA [Turicibacter sp.]